MAAQDESFFQHFPVSINAAFRGILRRPFYILLAVFLAMIPISYIQLSNPESKSINFDSLAVAGATGGLLFVIALTMYKALTEPFDSKQFEARLVVTRLAKLESRINFLELRRLVPDIDDNEKESLLEALRETLTSQAVDELLTGTREELRATAEKLAQSELRWGHWSETRARILLEISRLTRNALVNLIIGTMTTIVAIAILAYSLIQPSANSLTLESILPILSLRVSLALFIEIFSFFFLRLYKGNQLEIKYFHNELTNIETRAYALDAAKSLGDKGTLSDLLNVLAKIERNVVLKQGEKTVQIASDQLEAEAFLRAITLLSTSNVSGTGRRGTQSVRKAQQPTGE